MKCLLFIYLIYIFYRFAEGQLLSEASIDFDLLKAFLQKTGSKLLETFQEPTTLFKTLDLVKRIGNEVDPNSEQVVPIYVPKNVALLLFHPRPDEFFRGARTDIRVCTHDPPTNHSICGPIDKQIEEVMSLIFNTPTGAYPKQAVREIVTNAFLHRGYEESYNNPVEIKITPNFIDVYSYPGPDPSLKEEHFSDGNEVPRVKCKNIRLMELFKRVNFAEGWGTGIPTTKRVMKENNNPAPVFTFTPDCFRVRLPSVANCNAHLNMFEGKMQMGKMTKGVVMMTMMIVMEVVIVMEMMMMMIMMMTMMMVMAMVVITITMVLMMWTVKRLETCKKQKGVP